jgi:hypothetical protein
VWGIVRWMAMRTTSSPGGILRASLLRTMRSENETPLAIMIDLVNACRRIARTEAIHGWITYNCAGQVGSDPHHGYLC